MMVMMMMMMIMMNCFVYRNDDDDDGDHDELFLFNGWPTKCVKLYFQLGHYTKNEVFH